MILDLKPCRRCGESKPLSDFYRNAARADGVSVWCRGCTKADNDRRRSDPRVARYHRRYWKRWKYGLEQADFDRMIEQQGGACAVCGIVPTNALHIDHDHATGEIRALLCDRCNRGMGYFAEDPDRLESAARYLRAHQGGGAL